MQQSINLPLCSIQTVLGTRQVCNNMIFSCRQLLISRPPCQLASFTAIREDFTLQCMEKLQQAQDTC